MSENSKIEWTTHTWNPWEGCTKVSPGCANCYEEARNHRFGMDNWGKGKPRRRTSDANWRKPPKWDKDRNSELMDNWLVGRPCGRAPRIFPSLCDWLDDEVPIGWLVDFLKLIHDTPNIYWLLLTKRPENFNDRLNRAHWIFDKAHEVPLIRWILDWIINSGAPQNVWIGVSVEDQQRADERIPELLKIPAKVRFLSAEPLLGPVDIFSICSSPEVNNVDCRLGGERHLDWVIVGGESGLDARPCNVGWVESIVSECKSTGTPCFVKQLGQNCITDNVNCQDWPAGVEIDARGFDGFAAGHVRLSKKGGDPSQWPEDLRVREFPTVKY